MKKNRRLTSPVALALAAALTLNACATLPEPGTALTAEQREKAKRDCMIQYAVIGGIGGAILGNLMGGDRKGTLIGAVAGAALSTALAWGKCLAHYSDLNSFPVADAQQTAVQVGWTPARGTEVKIREYGLSPSTLKPGSAVKMSGQYYVMAPGGAQDVKVTETRTVSYFDPSENKWKDLGAVDQNLTAALGTRRAEGNFDLPNDVPEGRYRVTLKVSALGQSDSATQEIVVKKS